LTAIFHSLSFVVTPDLNNETERQIHELITTYRADMGAGFNRSFSDLFVALSSCFTFICLLAGSITAYLLRKKVSVDILKGITLITLIVFGCPFCSDVLLYLSAADHLHRSDLRDSRSRICDVEV